MDIKKELLQIRALLLGAYSNCDLLIKQLKSMNLGGCDTRSRHKLRGTAILSIWGNPTVTCADGNACVGNSWDNEGKLID